MKPDNTDKRPDSPLPLRTRLTSRKLWSMLIAVGVSWMCLERGVSHLYVLEAHQSYVYGGMFASVMALIGVAVSKYLNVETSYKASGSFVGTLAAAGQGLLERRDEHVVTEHTERIIDEGAPGAPARRPWSRLDE